MFNVKDGVSETTSTTGTGDFVLAARAGYLRFNDALVGNPHRFVYEVHAVDGSGVRSGAFETGVGQFFNDAGTHKIRRVRKLSGSDYPTMTPLDFAAGTKIVSLVVAAAQVGRLRVGKDQDDEPVTLYVRADGSDSNSGLADSAGGAFLRASASACRACICCSCASSAAWRAGALRSVCSAGASASHHSSASATKRAAARTKC